MQPTALNTFQQLNSATISGVPFPGRSMGEAVAFMEEKAAELLPQGMTYDWQGEARQFVQEGNTLALTFLFALIVIYLVLAAQFESFRDPLIILVALPTAMFGALLPMNLGAASINIYTQIGLVTLIGLISKHGILMVEFANRLQDEEGLDRRAAIERAACGTAAAHSHDHGGDGRRHGAAAHRPGGRGEKPLRYRARHRGGHDDRHDVHAVRDPGGLYLRGARSPSDAGQARSRSRAVAVAPARPGRAAETAHPGGGGVAARRDPRPPDPHPNPSPQGGGEIIGGSMRQPGARDLSRYRLRLPQTKA